MNALPSELQFKIIRQLDIDTRRNLGIYTKLRVPFSIPLTLPMPPGATSATNKLMFLRVSELSDIEDLLLKLKYDMSLAECGDFKMVLYKVAAWLRRVGPIRACVRAGIPDGATAADKFHMSVFNQDSLPLVYGIYLDSYDDF
jgi:hypothetical protein